MFKEFFKKYEPNSIEKLSKTRRKNIKAAVFERVNENGSTARVRSFRLKPAIAAAAAAIIAVTGVTVGAMVSPPDVKLDGELIEPSYYNVYTDVDGSTVEILVLDYPAELCSDKTVVGITPVGELHVGRRKLGDVRSEEDYSSQVWLTDENENEFTSLDNKIVQVKITYPDNSSELYSFNKANTNENVHHSAGFWGNGYYTVCYLFETDVCGYELIPEYAPSNDPRADALVEIFSLRLPDEALGEAVPGHDFPSFYSGNASGAKLKFFDEEGNKIPPVLTDITGKTAFPDGVNNLLFEININYSDGTSETMRIDPLNKLEGFDYDSIEFDYLKARYENVLESKLPAPTDEDGNPIEPDWESIINNVD